MSAIPSPPSRCWSCSRTRETALWTALRVLEECADLLRRLAGRQRGRGNKLSAGNFERRAAEVADRAEILRSALDRGGAAADEVKLTP